MSTFKKFRDAVEKQYNEMAKAGVLFVTDCDKDAIYETYLKSFPEGSNPMFRERTEHDCNTCKSFIRTIGNVVVVREDKMISVWDVTVQHPYQSVADTLSAYVKSAAIRDRFFHNERSVGKPSNKDNYENITWHHFSCEIPAAFYTQDVANKRSGPRTSKEVLKRGLDEISDDAINIVLDLITQNSLYRGEEHLAAVKAFKGLHGKYKQLTDETSKDRFAWLKSEERVARIRNSVIGTLLVDISDGVDLNTAIASFESKVAPANYKRTSAPITKGMIKQAMDTITELGIEPALNRRFATIRDISTNNVLFANHRVARQMKDPLEAMLMGEAKTGKATLSAKKLEDISIEKFITDVLPNIEEMEVMVDSNHESNMVSLITAVDESAANIFKWDNPFSWSYNGNTTDSIKQKVKNAGGQIEGDLRISLGWSNYDDLDLHVYEPSGYHINFNNKRQRSPDGGMLDVDMNISPDTRSAVENVIYETKRNMVNGLYKVVVNNFNRRESVDVGCTVELEFGGSTHTIYYGRSIPHKKDIHICDIEYKNGEFAIINLHQHVSLNTAQKEMWGVKTQEFYKVSNMMLSPNHWDGEEVGNKHYFFMLDGCKNPDQARGIYNEFLMGKLEKHRKVFEILGDKIKVGQSDDQLSGLGFSSTQRNELIAKVSGSFNRTLKIKF